jgi:hypothetical protein
MESQLGPHPSLDIKQWLWLSWNYWNISMAKQCTKKAPFNTWELSHENLQFHVHLEECHGLDCFDMLVVLATICCFDCFACFACFNYFDKLDQYRHILTILIVCFNCFKCFDWCFNCFLYLFYYDCFVQFDCFENTFCHLSSRFWYLLSPIWHVCPYMFFLVCTVFSIYQIESFPK